MSAMEDADLDLSTALERLAECRAAKEKAEAETLTVRTKLHGAVRKGKAIDVERLSLAKKLEQLSATGDQVRARPALRLLKIILPVGKGMRVSSIKTLLTPIFPFSQSGVRIA